MIAVRVVLKLVFSTNRLRGNLSRYPIASACHDFTDAFYSAVIYNVGPLIVQAKRHLITLIGHLSCGLCAETAAKYILE